jgi:hypothetical protein
LPYPQTDPLHPAFRRSHPAIRALRPAPFLAENVSADPENAFRNRHLQRARRLKGWVDFSLPEAGEDAKR